MFHHGYSTFLLVYVYFSFESLTKPKDLVLFLILHYKMFFFFCQSIYFKNVDKPSTKKKNPDQRPRIEEVDICNFGSLEFGILAIFVLGRDRLAFVCNPK